jgi:predicted secreted acid phosphatase
MRISGRPGARTLVAAASAVTLLAGSTAAADATAPHGHGPALQPRTHFTMAPDGSSGRTAKGDDIPNIDSVKSTIRTYYNATNGIADRQQSPYITEMAEITDSALSKLPPVDPADHEAVVLDADDTLLWTYDMEDGAMHFNFDPALQNTWVQDERFPATPSMVGFVDAVQDKGYAVFGLTGRNAAQEEATLGNLDKVDYTGFDADNFFTKWNTGDPVPGYVDCAADGDGSSCSTVEYKAFTRKHIEQDLGYDIALNVGDQWSDLQGGFADDTLKLPNPTYYLPSPDIAGAPAGDADLTPRTHFTMQPDGSSGLTEGGEGIPNIDSVKSTIRTYYNATNGIANKARSPYISELAGIAEKWRPKLRTACSQGVKKKQRPAVVFDADDTTLWTYDMEDGAMHFNFDPALQNTWVQEGRFPATPRMPGVVAAAAKAGCKIVGLTGRNNAQRLATLDNLARFYHDRDGDPLFKSAFYFTKWTSGDTPPAYVDCGLDGDKASCSTIDYKASTRRYVERRLHLNIVANFGDQFSDLIGGYADQPVKLPNPTYYLP